MSDELSFRAMFVGSSPSYYS